MTRLPYSRSSNDLISIGLPVFNGEKYLKASIDSLLSQDYGNFELIISDNGSTDATKTICQYYAQQDSRIIYYPHPNNKGAIWNFEYALHQAHGRYFMWASSHDLWHKDFLIKCKTILDSDPKVVLAYPLSETIDGQGTLISKINNKLDTRGLRRSLRTRIIIQDIHSANMFYGLFRREALAKCRINIPSLGADLVILMELGLQGTIAQLSETLFYRREFRDKMSLREQFQEQMQRIAPEKTVNQFTFWEMGRQYCLSTLHANIPFWEKPYILLNVMYSFGVRWKQFLYKELTL